MWTFVDLIKNFFTHKDFLPPADKMPGTMFTPLHFIFSSICISVVIALAILLSQKDEKIIKRVFTVLWAATVILELTKIQLYSQFRKQEDALSNTVPNLYAEIAGLKLLTFEEKMESVRNITKEDIVKAASKLKLDTIYFLKGVEDEENN